jgi:MiaB-like tRNA modifying enzyme
MKINIKTFGCAMNQRDSENIAGFLVSKGHEISDFDGAEAVIVNSCGVKQKSQHRILSFISSIKGKKVYVGGCLPRMINIKKYVKNVNGIFDINSIFKIIELLDGKKELLISNEKENRLNKAIIRKNKEIAIIPISQGCEGNCFYCCVKFARGKLKSYKKEEIIREVKKAVDENCEKIYLTAQDTGCWGRDINENLISLLKEVINVKGNFKIRLGMANPNFILEYLNELIEIYKSDRMMKFLHIPVQSGSDKVLKEMNRKYKVEDFKFIVKKFRENIKEMNISTDIIVGYPSEDLEDFNKTLELIREIKPEVLNISKFAPRPKTEASKLKQISTKEIKRRSVILSNEFNKIKKEKGLFS